MFRLNRGDAVDITAPSSPPPKGGEWRRGLQILKGWNLKPRFPEKALNPWLYHANTDSQRAFFLKQAFDRKESAAVWALRGGYGLQKIMPAFIKYFESRKSGRRRGGPAAALASPAPASPALESPALESPALESAALARAAAAERRPVANRWRKEKLFIGYSDSSLLHFYLNNQNQPTVHAPSIADLAALSPKDLSCLKQVLFGEKTEAVFHGLKAVLPPLFLKKRRGGGKGLSSARRLTDAGGSGPDNGGGAVLRAPVRGGNLSLLSGSAGTDWLPKLSGCFLFIEDVNEAAFRIDRMLWDLLAAGALKAVKAILFGSFHPLKTRQIKNPLSESLSSVCSVPLVFGLPCGHGAAQRPLPLNCPAELNFQEFQENPSGASLTISLS